MPPLYRTRQNRNLPARAGYIAVISAVIITAIVLAVALVFSSSNFLGRFDALFLEQKDIARGVAEGCLAYAKLKLAESLSYGGNESKSIGPYSCAILPVESAPGQKIIKATAAVLNRVSNLKLVVSDSTLEAISFEELAAF